MKFKIQLVKQTLILIFIACSGIINASSYESGIVSDTTQVVNERLLYKVTDDHSNIYVNISASDRRTMISMLRSGVTVYFDIKGKKKKDVYIKYPLTTPNFSGDRNQTGNGPDINQFIAGLPQEAEYKSFDNTQQFHIGLNSLDIALSLTYNDERQMLEYNLRIPKNRIDSGSKADLSKLTIGVETRQMQNLNQKRSGRSSSSSSMSMKGRGSGGGGGKGRGMQGGGRGNSGGKNSSQQNRQPVSSSNDFWFKTDID